MKRAVIILLLLLIPTAPCFAEPNPPQQWGVSVLELGTSTDARQEQLALRNCLDLMGIPYRTTDSVEEATRSQLVLVGAILENTLQTATEREQLYAFVEQGGVLLATQVRGNSFFPLFGLKSATTSRTNFRVRFKGFDDPALRYLNRPEEQTVSLGDPELYTETIWSTEYVPDSRARILAEYENGKAALTVYPYGRGLAYALGLGFKETTMIPQLARSFEAARRWINSFEPSGDVFRLLLRGLYEDSVHPSLLVHTVPEGRQTALVLSHDVDARESFRNSLSFAQMEDSLGVKSTFFVTTKYFVDETDINYYGPERISWIRKVKEMGFEIGSHSVSHSLNFEHFPIGDKLVSRKTYRTDHPTVFGETLVSKKLLDQDIFQQTAGFRAGYLRYPNELLLVLEESGYLFDSSVSAQYVLTNYPYFGFRQRSLGAARSNIVVIPVTLDDSREFLTPGTQDRALHTWLEIIRANAENNAMTCLLIHPNDATYKLETERRLIEALRNEDIWIGTVGELAQFWRQRTRLRPMIEWGENGTPIIRLNLPRAQLPPGQTLSIESQPGTSAPPVVDIEGSPVPVRSRRAGNRLLLSLP